MSLLNMNIRNLTEITFVYHLTPYCLLSFPMTGIHENWLACFIYLESNDVYTLIIFSRPLQRVVQLTCRDCIRGRSLTALLALQVKKKSCSSDCNQGP